MKTTFKHIRFEIFTEGEKTSTWVCLSNKSNDDLGTVKWYGGWGQYVFYPERETLFSGGCLNNIANFMKDLRAWEKSKMKPKKGN